LKVVKASSISLVVIGLILIVAFIISYYITGGKLPSEYDSSSALIGDSIGGVMGPLIGIFGVGLTFLAFYIQYEANNVQRKALFTEQFESKFFELLRLHRENVDRIKYRGDQGLYALKEMSKELQECCKKIKKRDSGNSLLESEVLTMGYHYFYSGINIASKKHIDILMNCTGDPAKDKLLRAIKVDLDTWVTDGGENVLVEQETRLEIYFNHILHVMSFLCKQTNELGREKKVFFFDTFKSQLTSREVALLLHCVLSGRDEKWKSPINYVKEFRLIDKVKEDQIGVEIQTINELI
jgi:hypothetical protein